MGITQHGKVIHKATTYAHTDHRFHEHTQGKVKVNVDLYSAWSWTYLLRRSGYMYMARVLKGSHSSQAHDSQAVEHSSVE